MPQQCQQPHDGFVKEGVHNNSDDLDRGHASADSVADSDVSTSSQVPTNNNTNRCVSLAANATPWDNSTDCNTLMSKAYGATLSRSGSSSNSDWHSRWKSVVHHSGNHYVLPGGPTGRRYIDLLVEEVQQLAVRALIFSCVMLQRDQMVRKGADIRRLLDQCINQWLDGHFDLLVQEDDRCDSGLKCLRRANINGDDVARIFSRLMLQGFFHD